MLKQFCAAVVWVWALLPVFASEQLIGDWQGLASAEKENTGFILHISRQQGTYQVSVSLSDIGVSRWPAQIQSLSDNGLSIDLPSDSDMQRITLERNNNRLIGFWKDSLTAEPSSIDLQRTKTVPRVQEYRTSIRGEAGNIGVSYFLPEGVSLDTQQQRYTGMVLTHGSGPVSRDINRFIAESFARLGIVAAIYDKRGIAETEGDYDAITFEQLAADTISVANHLHSYSGIGSVGFWGHSQGGWVAPLAAHRWDDSAFVITSAGPLVSPAREAEWAYIYPLLNREDFDIAKPHIRQLVSAWHDGLRRNDFSHYLHLVEKYEYKPWFEASGINNLPTYCLGQFYDSYKLYMDYNPAQVYEHLNTPMMLIYAPDDESIDSRESIKIARNLKQRGKNLELIEYPGYSHSMRKLPIDSNPLRFPNYPADYFTRQAEFIESAVTTLH